MPVEGEIENLTGWIVDGYRDYLSDIRPKLDGEDWVTRIAEDASYWTRCLDYPLTRLLATAYLEVANAMIKSVKNPELVMLYYVRLHEELDAPPEVLSNTLPKAA